MDTASVRRQLIGRRLMKRAALLTSAAALLVTISPAEFASGGTRPARAERALTATQAAAELERKPVAAGAKPARVVKEQKGAAAEKKAERKPAGTTRGHSRFDEARRRYAEALGLKPVPAAGKDKQAPGFSRMPDRAVLDLDKQGVAMLIARDWRGAGGTASNAREQSERTRTLVAIARALKLSPTVGALQATFGTPAENGLLELSGGLSSARDALARSPGHADLAAIFHERERELAAALASLPRGPKEGWALIDLDVNADGRIDRADIETARAGRQATPAPTSTAARGEARRQTAGLEEN